MSSAPTVYPAIRYDDCPAAIEWLTANLGLTEQMVVPGEADGTIAHAQLTWRNGMVMLGSESDGDDGRLAADNGPAWLYLVADDVDDHYERVKAAGAEIVREIEDEDYGNRSFTTRDPEGNLWTFGTYRPEVDAG